MIIYKDDPEKAIREIFRICENENVLTEYLSAHRSEVEKIMLTMVSPEYFEKAARKSASIRASVESLRDCGVPEEQIKEHLVKKYNITPGYAQNCLETDWEDED